MIVYSIAYVVSYFLSRDEHYYLSGVVLMGAALWLYVADYRRFQNPIHLRALFSLSWVGGQGLACLKLSRLQTDWSWMTWLCMALALMGFWVTFEVASRFSEPDMPRRRRQPVTGNPKPVFYLICGLTALSLMAFLIEAFYLGYVPLLVRGVPHAYSEFHLTGLHYFTVSCVLVPSLSVVYFQLERGRGCEQRMITAFCMTLVSLAIPILCVSRFQFVFAVILMVMTYIVVRRQFSPLYLVGMAAVIVPVYLILSVARSHDVTYLNGIFEMKNANMPIFITQPYMYIANNYENFNCLVDVLPAHTFGMRQLYPLWALSGLKFFYPQLVGFPIYVDKKELTTLTLFYDAYYDFGWAGVLVFSCLLGLVAYLLVSRLKDMQNPIGYLLYAQMGAYMALSFFTTWFSNTTTWFYLILTGMMALFYQMNLHRR